MDPCTAAKTVLERYPSLKWMAKQPQHFDWEVEGERVTLQPKEGDPIALRWGEFFPVIIEGERVSLPAFHLDDYPCADSRSDLGKGETKAMLLLCNRFIRSKGHSFLYLHYPARPEDDKIINFNNGKDVLGHLGMRRTVEFVHRRTGDVTEPELRGVTSFAGFPITERQAEVLEADSILTMANPSFAYHLISLGKDAVNCIGYAMTRVQAINEPLGQLTGKHDVKRLVCNDHLPDMLVTRPDRVHASILQRAAEGQDRTTASITAPAGSAKHGGAMLRLARNGELLLGHTSAVPMALANAGRDKFLAHDIVEMMDQLLPQVLDPQAKVKPLGGTVLRPLACSRQNDTQQPTLGLSGL